MPESTIHEPSHPEPETAPGSDRSFGLVFAGAFAVIGLVPLVHAAPPRLWALALAALFLLAVLVRPGILHPLNRVWALLGAALHKVVSPIVLGLLFFAVVTPLALLMRLWGKDPLRRGFDARAASYWLRRDQPTPDAQTLRRQF
jgi:hypothetical protein